MIVIFDIIKEEGNNRVIYPDDRGLFRNSKVLGTQIIADYSGSLSLEAYLDVDEALQASKIKELNNWHDAQLKAQQDKYSAGERASFKDKREAALKSRDGSTAPAGYFMSMSSDPVRRQELADSVLVVIDTLGALELLVKDTRKLIEACTTQAELDAIVIGG